MTTTTSRSLRPPADPVLLAALIEDAGTCLRTAEKVTYGLTMALPDLRPSLVGLADTVTSLPALMRYLRRQAEAADPSWLRDDRGVAAGETLGQILAALDSAVADADGLVARVAGIRDQVGHVHRDVDLSGLRQREPDEASGVASGGLSGEDDVLARIDNPTYDRTAIPLGPFDSEPFGLDQHFAERPDGTPREGHHRAACAAAWMVAALDAGGVALGAHDRFIAALLASDGPSVVEVVAGWVARAHPHAEPTSD